MKRLAYKISILPLMVCFPLYSAVGNSAELKQNIKQLGEEQKQLIEMSLDDLLNLQVTSVSKKPQKISESAAAIFVITHQDIKKSGVTSIPEALRMAPGIDVAKIDDNEWAVSSRGFNGRFANKLLVLIDGRTIYTPFFSGVNWDVQNTLLEDIDRIEVIRGPGASLWGANAVNGVINIITKTADQTQGGYVLAGGGSTEKVFGGFRYGGKINETINYRFYSKYFERETDEKWQMGHGGARLDWRINDEDTVIVQGDIYQGKMGDSVNQPNFTAPYNTFIKSTTNLAGGNISLRWMNTYSADESTALQIYYDYTEKDTFEVRLEHSTLNIDFQHSLSFESNDFTWGVAYRFISDDVDGSFLLMPTEAQTDTHLLSLFVQNEWELIENKLKITLGSKFEHNDYSGFEVQPSARIIWTPSSKQSVWASVSRAVRTSSRAEQGGVINQQMIEPSAATLNLPVLVSLVGSIGNSSEKLIAYEVGYRLKPANQVSVDTAVFYNSYSNLRNFHPNTPQFSNTHFIQSISPHTDMSGEVYGAEIALSWQALDTLKINATYSYLQIQMHVAEGESNLSEDAEGKSPHHKFSIRSSFNVLSSLDWDLWLRYADNIPNFKTPSYLTIETRLAWRPTHGIEISLVGQNLLDSHHPEFGEEIVLSAPGEVERSVYGKIEWHF